MRNHGKRFGGCKLKLREKTQSGDDVKENCCFGCEKRYVGCHAECEDYKAWKEEHEQIRAIEFAERMKIVNRAQYDVDRAKRVRKATGKK